MCEDNEYLYFAERVTGLVQGTFVPLSSPSTAATVSGSVPPAASQHFRVYTTCSAHTEGYYKMPHMEKGAYIVQYTTHSTEVELKKAVKSAVIPQQPLAPS